jgi:hypothetical protein
MIVRVPASAPLVPPLTGASAKATSRPASLPAIRRDVAGSPEVQASRHGGTDGAESQEGGRPATHVASTEASTTPLFR